MTSATEKVAWTDADRATLVALYNAGFDNARIAALMNRSEKAIAVARSRLKLAPAITGRTHRPCMCCRRSFASEGKHNRLCDPCREVAANEYGVDFYVRAA
jgi:hypothetical protein